jgi:hypothetical protein
MASKDLRSVLEFWFDANRQPVGIIVTTDDRNLLMNRLYEARREYQKQDPGALSDLSICISPTNDSELWIIHKTVKVDENGQPR